MLTQHQRFIVLQHDISEISIDLAVGYTLDAALVHQPKFTVSPIHVPLNKLGLIGGWYPSLNLLVNA